MREIFFSLPNNSILELKCNHKVIHKFGHELTGYFHPKDVYIRNTIPELYLCKVIWQS
jgi:hypothetical protein